MKKQATDWEKIYTIPRSDKGFVFRIFKELSQLNHERQAPK